MSENKVQGEILDLRARKQQDGEKITCWGDS